VQPGNAGKHSLPSSATAMEEQSYTSTQTLGHTGPVTGSLYLFPLYHNTEINLLTPNVNNSGRTAPLTSKVAFYIFIQQI